MALPARNSVKINTDAALFKDPRRYSYALIVRDYKGDLVEAVSKCSQGRVTPEFAEAISIREALSWTKNAGKENVIVESDCLQVVQLIRNSYSSLSYLGRVVQECRDLMLQCKAKNTKLRFVKRSANSVAHYLARYSCLVAERKWRMGDVHPEFSYVLCKDLILQ